MKCIAISDTHGMFSEVAIPDGDILIHAGDILGHGSLSELKVFNDWLGNLPHKFKIVIAGNHDWCFERDEEASREILTNAIYLQDESINIEGISFYGSPWQPWFLDWAFNLQPGRELKDKWDLIPDNVDVLITHGPCQGILDKTDSGDNVGCDELRKAINRVQPKYHICGHIHEGYGILSSDGCNYINASINTVRYMPINPAIIFDVTAANESSRK